MYASCVEVMCMSLYKYFILDLYQFIHFISNAMFFVSCNHGYACKDKNVRLACMECKVDVISMEKNITIYSLIAVHFVTSLAQYAAVNR